MVSLKHEKKSIKTNIHGQEVLYDVNCNNSFKG